MTKPNPRAYDDKFIREQLDEMVRKNWTTLEIASWFSHWAFEEGKMEIMTLYSKRTKHESEQEVVDK
jgi:hypothetical protein